MSKESLDMSYEIQTRTEARLPQGSWTLVLRLAGIGNTPINPLVSAFLDDQVPKSVRGGLARRKLLVRDESDGAIYARYDGAAGTEGMPILQGSVSSIIGGTNFLEIDVEIQARMDPTRLVSRDRSLRETFGYLHNDVTLEARDVQESLPPLPLQFDTAEFEHLQDH